VHRFASTSRCSATRTQASASTLTRPRKHTHIPLCRILEMGPRRLPHRELQCAYTPRINPRVLTDTLFRILSCLPAFISRLVICWLWVCDSVRGRTQAGRTSAQRSTRAAGRRIRTLREAESQDHAGSEGSRVTQYLAG
jgi:hypothetical protein